MTRRHAIPVLLTLLLLAAPATAQTQEGKAGAEEEKPTPKARFYQARKVMLGGDAKSAAELFRTLEAEHRKSEVADDCLYWMGRCYLRVPDREPDAVVAFSRLVREHEESPFVDDAARELAVLGDRKLVPVLKKRAAAGGAGAETAKRALEEFGAKADEQDAKKPEKEKGKDTRDEVRRLEAEIARLTKEVEEVLVLVKELLAKKEKADAAKKPAESGDKKEER